MLDKKHHSTFAVIVFRASSIIGKTRLDFHDFHDLPREVPPPILRKWSSVWLDSVLSQFVQIPSIKLVGRASSWYRLAIMCDLIAQLFIQS